MIKSNSFTLYTEGILRDFRTLRILDDIADDGAFIFLAIRIIGYSDRNPNEITAIVYGSYQFPIKNLHDMGYFFKNEG